jgi:hypothetical protein
MLVSESSAIHQLRRRSAQKPQLDWIADRMPLEHCAVQQHNQDDNQPNGQSANKNEIDASTART